MQPSSNAFFLGLAVWAYPDFFGSFYPLSIVRKSALFEYGKRLHCVECNSPFYAQPSLETVQFWRTQVPPSFRFVPKLSQEISHRGTLADKFELARRQVDQIKSGLEANCGPFMLQLPPSYSPRQGTDLAQFLNAWRRAELGEIAVEFRHVAWWAPEWFERSNLMLNRLGMGRIILDTRAIYADKDDPQKDCPNKKQALPVSFENPYQQIIVRYIAHPEASRNHVFWAEWQAQIGRWFEEGRQVYFFMHCPQEQFSPNHAREFYQQLRQRYPDLPILPWDNLPPDPQLSLF